jgi:hypothetical protein
MSKTREQAELAFNKVQSQFIARGLAEQASLKRDVVVEYRSRRRPDCATPVLLETVTRVPRRSSTPSRETEVNP